MKNIKTVKIVKSLHQKQPLSKNVICFSTHFKGNFSVKIYGRIRIPFISGLVLSATIVLYDLCAPVSPVHHPQEGGEESQEGQVQKQGDQEGPSEKRKKILIKKHT